MYADITSNYDINLKYSQFTIDERFDLTLIATKTLTGCTNDMHKVRQLCGDDYCKFVWSVIKYTVGTGVCYTLLFDLRNFSVN